MHLQPFIDQRTDHEQHDGDDPEVHGGIKILPEPLLSVNGAAVALHDVHQRIDLQKHLHILAHLPDIPQDRRRPHADLQADPDDLLQIPEIDHNGTGGIADRQHQGKGTEAVIEDLQGV